MSEQRELSILEESVLKSSKGAVQTSTGPDGKRYKQIGTLLKVTENKLDPKKTTIIVPLEDEELPQASE